VISSAEEGLAKPRPEIYRRAAARLGLPPEACVFVDDYEANVRAAEELGMRASSTGWTAARISPRSWPASASRSDSLVVAHRVLDRYVGGWATLAAQDVRQDLGEVVLLEPNRTSSRALQHSRAGTGHPV
jgi:beta-phosphoglucomutase-like phosphatase (HAD superfamily)